ncbi:uncharacterized protein BDR25DRAFT_360203 [Lindgomyces ingoldianus]|uniref:Uncharacterized protein n=1 Tax=Lindgomyces ingoldianus TaxID=673940 RepID=A0ACB6QFH4_9PLEO|nr:uncharacterized protein BDR25DRAFT_360203 [Lindgomyces ingoldianus]KAF2465676.1 hypothetical protein BDR25DRAFT_360203 [Lindgomyces ingoldianus]
MPSKKLDVLPDSYPLLILSKARLMTLKPPSLTRLLDAASNPPAIRSDEQMTNATPTLAALQPSNPVGNCIEIVDDSDRNGIQDALFIVLDAYSPSFTQIQPRSGVPSIGQTMMLAANLPVSLSHVLVSSDEFVDTSEVRIIKSKWDSTKKLTLTTTNRSHTSIEDIDSIILARSFSSVSCAPSATALIVQITLDFPGNELEEMSTKNSNRQ